MMNTNHVKFSSRSVLQMAEETGLAGNWGWTFASNEHRWSPGLYRILGLKIGDVKPSYSALLSYVHQEDVSTLESPDEVRRYGVINKRIFRILTPGGPQRVLSSHGTVHFDADGRPIGASAFVVDLSDQDRLSRIVAAQRLQQKVLFDLQKTFTFSHPGRPGLVLPPEFSVLSGIPEKNLAEDFSQIVLPKERAAWLAAGFEGIRAGRPFITTPTLITANGGAQPFNMISAPIRDEAGVIEGWAVCVRPVVCEHATIDNRFQKEIEQSISGRDLSSARSLLGWSMRDLARYSALSYSTIRRAENCADDAKISVRYKIVAALRNSGIRFSIINNGIIVVSKK